MTNKLNQKLLNVIHKIFIKYDIIWVIEKGFPDDEYQLEESKLFTYIENNPNSTELGIYNELVKIIEDWFWDSPLYKETLNKLKRMSNEIYEKITYL